MTNLESQDRSLRIDLGYVIALVVGIALAWIFIPRPNTDGPDDGRRASILRRDRDDVCPRCKREMLLRRHHDDTGATTPAVPDPTPAPAK